MLLSSPMISHLPARWSFTVLSAKNRLSSQIRCKVKTFSTISSIKSQKIIAFCCKFIIFAYFSARICRKQEKNSCYYENRQTSMISIRLPFQSINKDTRIRWSDAQTDAWILSFIFYLPILDGMRLHIKVNAHLHNWQTTEGETLRILLQIYLFHCHISTLV